MIEDISVTEIESARFHQGEFTKEGKGGRGKYLVCPKRTPTFTKAIPLKKNF